MSNCDDGSNKFDDSNEEQSEALGTCTFENCDQPPIGNCNECKLAYCLDHASEVDPGHFCCNCLVPADTEVKEKPLIDSNGVQHIGRIISPVGRSYRLSEKLVPQMSDTELTDYIEYGKQMVASLSNMKLHWDISLGLAESEAWLGRIGGLAKLGGELRVGTSTQQFKRNAPRAQRKSTTNANAKAEGKVDKTLELLKALGLKPEDLVSLINALPKSKASK